MFYVKKKLADGAEINVNIECDNVYTRCPDCGVERMIDLVEFAKDEGFDFESSYIYCEKCSSKIAR